MVIRPFIVSLICILVGHSAEAQRSAIDRRNTVSWADSVWNTLQENRAREPMVTLALTDTLLDVYWKFRDDCKRSGLNSFRSMSFDQLGQLDSALANMQRAFELFHPDCDSILLLRAYLAQTNVLLSFQEHATVDSICREALRLWQPWWSRTAVRNGLLTNQAIAAANLGDLEGAFGAFREILRLARAERNEQDMDDAMTNIGVLHNMAGDLDSSDVYFRQALREAELKGSPSRIVKQYMNLARNQSSREHYRAAIAIYDSALVFARSAGELKEQVWLEREISTAYTALGDHARANMHLMNHVDLNDSLLSIEKLRAITEMQEKYESEKKAREIKELQVQKLDADLIAERVKRTRNIYLFSGIGIFVAALGLWSRLRFVHRSRAAIRKEKDISEGLLLNILPSAVADELKAKGAADAQLFDQVTVLFTDFKGFTAVSERLSPKDLVRDIHECFSAFDHIMTKYGIEKIKTIGDAYMAAGGLPTPNATHAQDVLQAALELRDFIAEGMALKRAAGLPFFEIRIGIHTGPVVAGIVGVKKFAYDIWGDTVNTASRMESSGEAGQVNISGATYELVRNDLRFTFTARGKVAAKGKGELEMYFVHRSTGTA